MLLLKVCIGGDAVVTTYLVRLVLWLHPFCVLWSDRGKCRGRAKALVHIHHHLRRCEQEASFASISIPQMLVRKNRIRICINVIAVLVTTIIPIIIVISSILPSGAGAIGSFTVSDVHRRRVLDRVFGFDHWAGVGW